jgi:hypothetical protein
VVFSGRGQTVSELGRPTAGRARDERERERERERAREIGYRESRVRPYTVDGDGRRPAYS